MVLVPIFKIFIIAEVSKTGVELGEHCIYMFSSLHPCFMVEILFL